MCLLLQFLSLFTLIRLPRPHLPHEEWHAVNFLTWASRDDCSQIKQKQKTTNKKTSGAPRLNQNVW